MALVSGGTAGSTGTLLAAAYYNPSGGVVTKTATGTLVALDTTNLRATFTLGTSGVVIVKCGGGRLDPANSNPFIGVLEGGATLGVGSVIQAAAVTTTIICPAVSFRFTGVTAASHSYDLAFQASNIVAAATWKYGFATSDFADASGTCFIEVWSGI